MADNNLDLNIRVNTQAEKIDKLIQDLQKLGKAGATAADQTSEATKRELGLFEKLETQLKDLQKLRQNAKNIDEIKQLNLAIQQTEKNLGELSTVGRQTATFTEFFSQKLEGLTGELGSLAKNVGVGGAAIVGLIGILAAGASAAISAADATAKLAKDQLAIQRSTGASAGFIAALTAIIKQYGGEVQNVQELLLQVGGVVNQALAEPTGTTAEKFKLLGVAFQDVNGRARSVEAILKDVDKAAKEVGLTAQQLAALSTIVGEEAAKQFLDRFGQIQELEDILRETGAVLSEEILARANAFNKESTILQARIDGLTTAFGNELLEALTRVKEIANEALKELDPDTIEGFKGLVQDLGRVLVASAETAKFAFDKLFDGIKVGTTTVFPGIGQLAEAVSALLNPLDTLNFLQTGNPKITEAVNVANKKLIETFTAGTFAADKLSQKINQLAQDQNFLTEITSIASKQQIAFIEEQVRLGFKSRVDAAKEIEKIENDQLSKATDNAFNRLAKVKESLAQETKIKEKEALQQAKAEEDLKNKILAAKQEIKDFERKAFEEEFNADGKDLASQQRLEALKQFNAAQLSIKLQGLKALEGAEVQARENTRKAEQELSDFRLAINTKSLVDERTLSADKLKARQEIQQATLDLEKAEEAQNNKRLEQRRNTEKNILADRQTTLDAIEENEKDATEKLTRELEARAITQEQFNQKELASKIEFAEKKLKAEQDALAKLNASEQASLNEKVAASKRVLDLQAQIEGDKRKERIADAQSELNALKSTIEAEQSFRNSNFELRKLQISQIKDANLKAIQEQRLEIDIANEAITKANEKILLEQKTLEVLKEQGATKEQLLAQEAKINAAITDSLKALEAKRTAEKNLLQEKIAGFQKSIALQQQENQAITDLAERSKSAAGAIKGGLAQVTDQTDIASLSIEDLKTRIEELGNSANFIENFFAFAGKQNVVNDIRDTVEKLNTELVTRAQRAAIEAAQREAEARLAQQRETQRQLEEIEQEGIERRQEALQERREELEEIDQQEKDLLADRTRREEEEAKELADRKLEIAQDLADKEKEIAERAAREEEERQRRLIETKEKIALDAADRANSIARSALVERAKLEAQIASETDPKKRAELQKQLAEVTKKGSEAESREKRKQAELEKLLSENLSEEELKARQEAIERKFKLEEDAARQREELIKSNNTKELAELNKLIAEQKKRDEERLAAELKRIADQQKRKEEQAKAERDKIKADYEQRLKDLQEAFDKQQAKEKEDHAKRLAELEERKKQIKAKYKETLEEIQADQLKAASELAKSAGLAGDAFNKFFDTATEKGKKLLDVLNQINNSTPGQGSTSSSAGSTSSSSSSTPTLGGTSGSTTSGGASPFSGGTSGSNSGSGSIGGTSGGRAGIAQQPKGDKGGNPSGGQQPGGVKKGNNSIPATGQTAPPSANDQNSFRRGVIKIREIFSKEADTKKDGSLKFNTQTEKAIDTLNKSLDAIIKSYFSSAGLDSTKVGATETSFLYGSIRELRRETYKTAIENIINFVEANRKSEGKDKFSNRDPLEKTDKPVDIGQVPTGDKGGDGFGDKGKPTLPTSNAEPPPSRGRDLSDKERQLALDRDKFALGGGGVDESAEFAKTFAASPNVPASAQPGAIAPTPPANVNANAQVQNAVSINNLTLQVGAESLGVAVEKAVLGLIQSGKIARDLTNQVSSQMASDNFSRTPGKRVVI